MADEIFVRIRHALEAPADSSEIALVISSVRAAIGDNRAWRAEHEAAILDPLAETEAVRTADAALAETHLRERRLGEAERRLEIKLAEVRETETEADRRARFVKAKALRDKAAAEVRDAWTKHAKGLAAVVDRIAKVDAEVRAACDVPPKGETAIDSVIAGLVLPGTGPNVRLPFTALLNLPPVPEWGAPGLKSDRLVQV